MRLYRLKKSKKALLHCYHLFLKKRKKLDPSTAEKITKSLEDLQNAILSKNRPLASEKAEKLLHEAEEHLAKTFFEKARDFVLGIGFALFVAILIRQMWFELYEIPTGSMRPTFKEQDRLSVSKTDFGINFPLKPRHLYFDPHLVHRNGIVVFTVENMDVRDPDTVYFFLFPGKKLFVKRLIGKPGDTLYFYGGKIYGMDQEGSDISSELQDIALDKIDHIPFISFEGKLQMGSSPKHGIFSPLVLYQMNEPVARLWATETGQVKGELFPKIAGGDSQMHYANIWGFENFAMARLLTKEQVKQLTDQDPPADDALLYLELRHHPNLNEAKIGRDEWNRLRPMLGVHTSIIPLQENQLKTLFANLYTGRFIVEKGFAHRYGFNPSKFGNNSLLPYLPAIPNGTYEFYYGQAYAVKWQGYTSPLPPSHPLCRFDVTTLQTLFNAGIDFDTRFNPQTKGQTLYPTRLAYFREGNLYVMGLPLLEKDSPTLQAFVEREKKRQQASFNPKPYPPFLDKGPPLLSDGTLDKDLLSRFGLKVPKEGYLVLGDNHSNSGDSRDFGFVPEGNLRGGPSFIFWPPGPRFGTPNQPPYVLWNFARITIWGCALVGFSAWFVVHRRRTKLPLKLK